jgi:hypothetical protein
VGAGLDHLPGDPDAEFHLPVVVAVIAVASSGVGDGAAGIRDLGVVLNQSIVHSQTLPAMS